MKEGNARKRTLWFAAGILLFLAVVMISGMVLKDTALETDFSRKNLLPGLKHWFGTDWMGRDMFARTMTGLSLSIRIGLLTAAISAVIALIMGAGAALCGRWADAFVLWLIDLTMGIPHMLLLLLVSFACGKGFVGVVTGVSLSHWPSLARLLRAEVLQLKTCGYVQVAGKLGMNKRQILKKHMLPHLIPQFFTGLVLTFPHAILHEASITFLGFGLPPEQPAIGVILSESMQYLVTGKWWLALFPGLLLVITVILFDMLGKSIRTLTDPASVHR